MKAKQLVNLALSVEGECEVEIWYDSAPRGTVEAAYDTADGKRLVLCAEWDDRVRELAVADGMDCAPLYSERNINECLASFVSWPGERPEDFWIEISRRVAIATFGHEAQTKRETEVIVQFIANLKSTDASTKPK